MPGVAETLDWVRALTALGEEELDPEVVEATLGAVLKNREDLEQVRAAAAAIVAEVRDAGGAPLP
jgi:phage terminase large subunit-like protein